MNGEIKMKNISKLFISTIILGAITAPAIVSAADGGGVYGSNGVVIFEPNTDPTDPVDPTDPTNPVEPIDPTDSDSSNPGTNGPLSIDFASSLDFGTQKITSKDEIYHAVPQKYVTSETDAEGNLVTKKGPNYVQVTDNRGTEAGWILQVNQNGQFKSETGKELTGAVITLNNGTVVTASESGKPAGEDTIALNAEGALSKVMTAAAGNGAGTYLLTWGTDEVSGAESITLDVPGATTKYAEKYSTTLTWTLSDTPSN